MTRIFAFVLSLCIGLGALTPALAGPERYRLDLTKSKVHIAVLFQENEVTVALPIKAARFSLDLANIETSKVSLELNAARARSGVPFLAGRVKAPNMLHTAEFPTITFDSTLFALGREGLELTGDVTIRDQTRPLVLTARVTRPRGAPRDNSVLAVELQGQLDRFDFGVRGYPKAVGRTVDIVIEARIKRQN